MFANLPQKLTAPLGLLSDEAKLAFRSRPGGISKLISTRVRLSTVQADDVPIIFVTMTQNIAENDSYWDQVRHVLAHSTWMLHSTFTVLRLVRHTIRCVLTHFAA